MARIVYSALIDNIRGSIGGTTFQKNAYGYTVKKKPNQVFPASIWQQRQKIIIKQVLHFWSNMSAAYRADYVSYASTYPQYSKHNPSCALSGHAVFVKHNFYRLLGEFSILDAISFGSFSIPSISISIELDGSTLNIIVDTDNVSTYLKCAMFITPPLPPSQTFFGTRYRYFLTFPFIDGTVDVAQQYINIFGALPSSGQLVGISFLFWHELYPQVSSRFNQIPLITSP